MASFWQNKQEITGYDDQENASENIISSGVSSTATRIKMEKADRLNGLNELEKAYEIYKEILYENTGHADALFGIGIILEKQQKYDLALQFLSRAIESNPGKTQALLMRGSIFRKQGMSKNAILDFTRHPK